MPVSASRVLTVAIGVLLGASQSTSTAVAADKPPGLTDKPHNCATAYPKDALEQGIEGRVGLHITITAKGDVANPSVTESSGNDSLDRASTACVLDWKYKPATHDGDPVAIEGDLHVNWRLPDIPIQSRRDCLSYYGVKPDEHADRGATLLSYDVDAGAVRNVAVSVSSGDESLDRNALDCVTAWRYAPTNPDGTPTKRHMKQMVLWATDRPTPASGSRHICSRDSWAVFAGSGSTRVAYTIATDGSVKDAFVWESSGNSILDGASLSCVLRWRFNPIILDGKAVEFPFSAFVKWTLH